MRIRSLHPSYLDAKGLVALRRETLLAKHVLEGKTKGYTMHPQLDRFKAQTNPLSAINAYLTAIAQEATARGYKFDTSKIGAITETIQIPVTKGQLQYELQRLCTKLQTRDPEKHKIISRTKDIHVHELFVVIPGGIEEWERV